MTRKCAIALDNENRTEYYVCKVMGYYVSPRFLDKLAIHITKNFMDLPGVRVPLILGIHGRKGEGKSFQCELVFKSMGIEPVRMSAGELESPDAGDPVRLIRTRYREAAELIKVRGKMCVLLINDLDAGAGRVDKTTQYTVNTQLVNGTLMNIADNPNDVQLPGSYETQPIHRVPIIVTGNDFSTLYAPLVRDGRMDKFYWEPSHDDRIGVVMGIFEEDRLPASDVEKLVNTFPQQSIDFFGALRSRVYDEQVRQFIRQVGIDRVSQHLVNNPSKTLDVSTRGVSLARLIELGQYMVEEQQRLQRSQLSQEYISNAVSPTQSSGNGQPVVSYAAAPRPSQIVVENPLEYSQETSSSSVAWPGQISLADVERLLENAIRQGGRLSIEVASKREKAGNVWRSWPWSQEPINGTKAIESLLDCIRQNPNSFVKLIGYNPQTQKRLLEEIIVRP
jgi:ribulose bisphosphate carboxylase small subunit